MPRPKKQKGEEKPIVKEELISSPIEFSDNKIIGYVIDTRDLGILPVIKLDQTKTNLSCFVPSNIRTIKGQLLSMAMTWMFFTKDTIVYKTLEEAHIEQKRLLKICFDRWQHNTMFEPLETTKGK